MILNRATFTRCALAVCLTPLLSGCWSFGLFGENTSYSIQGLQDYPETQDYAQGILDDRLKNKIEEDKDTEDYIRAESDRESMITGDLQKALYARGHYDARVIFENDPQKLMSGTYKITAGAPYTIDSVTITPKDFAQQELNIPALEQGKPLIAADILQAQALLRERFTKDRCLFRFNIGHRVLLDQSTHKAKITFTIDAGQDAVFGDTAFSGLEKVKENYLRKLIPWKNGDCYQRKKVEAYTTTLLETGLFARAESKLPEALNADNAVPIRYELKERARRSVKVGAHYYTDTGVGILLGWEHRNLFGAAEKLEAELRASTIEQDLTATFTKPHFMRKDQNLSLSTSLGYEDTDAYEATNFDIAGNISRKINNRLSVTTGAEFSLSEIDEGDTDGAETYALFSFPNSITYDSRDDTLDAHSGVLLNASIEPFFDALGTSNPFIKTQGSARSYFELAEKPDLVLALRGNIGSIVGDNNADIPPTERFFAGGGGSVRGFGYQEVGPFENDEPAGGRSLITASSELRFRVTDTIGGAAFVDAGSVSESSSPDFDNFSVGAGLGARYFTDFGPLRLDIGVPLNRRDELDSNYQIYMSIGQAF